MLNKEIKFLGFNIRLDLAIAFLIIGMILGSQLFCSCLKVQVESENANGKDKIDIKEGMSNLLSSEISPNSWISKASEYAGNMGYNSILAKHETNKGGQVPLPEGQLSFLYDNEFKPECCPSSYSSSSGCACLSSEQVNYLNQRGGNRTMPTNY